MAHTQNTTHKVGMLLEHFGYGRAEVIAVNEDGTVTERDLTGQTPGRIRRHFTQFNPKHTRVLQLIDEPALTGAAWTAYYCAALERARQIEQDLEDAITGIPA